MDTNDADVTHGAVARTNAIAPEEQMPTATTTSLSSELQIGENLDISRQEDKEGVAAKIAVDSGRDRTESGNGTEKGFVGGIEEELTLPELRNAGLDQTTDVNEFKGNMQVEIPDSEMSEGMTCSPVKAVAERDVGISEAPVVDTRREAIHQIMYGNPHADSPDAVQKLLSGVEAERTKWEKKRQSLNLWGAEHGQEYFTEWYLWENKRLVKQKAEAEGWAGVLTMVLEEKDLTDEHRSRDAVIALNVLLRRHGLGDSIDALEAASMTPTDEEQRNSLTSLARPDFAEFRKVWENRRGWSTPNLEPGELQRIVSTEEKTSGPHVDRDSQCLTTENHIEIQKGLPDSSSDHKHLDPSASLSNSIKDNNVEAVVGFSNKPPEADVGIPASETEGFVHTGNHQAENENAPSDIPYLEYTSSGNIQPSSYTRDFQEALILMASSPPYVETADPNGSLALPDNEKELRLADAEMQNMISQTTDAPAKQINSSPCSSDEQVHKPRTSSRPKSTNDTAITAIGTESTSIPDSDDVESSVKDVEMPEMTEDIAKDARGLVKSEPYLVSEKKDWPEYQSCSSTPFIDKTFEDEVPAIATELPETSRRIITSPKKHPREGFLLTIGNHDRLEERPASLQAAPNDTTAMEADNCISSALATQSEPASSLANIELTRPATNKDAMTGVESVAPGISLPETNPTLTRIKPTATPIKFYKSPFSPQKPSSDVPAPLQPTTPSALFNAPPKAAGGQQNSQNQDVIMAELKAIKMTSIKARNEKLKEDIAAKKAKLEEVTNDLENPAKDIVARHIKLLHDYNDIRDVGQGLVGMIADNRGVRIGELYEEFGVGLKD